MHKKYNFLILSFSLFIFVGCASNDDDSIQVNKKLELIRDLDNIVHETSGLVLIDDVLITHNDKGNDPFLYVLDTATGNIINTIEVNTSFSSDWEDLAQNENFIFIGDFGNNDGNRVDLKILKINKQNFNPKTDNTLNVEEIIFFNYPEQTNFSPNNNHNYDCEAFFYFNENLYLFTKNRVNRKTYLYQIPATQGNYAATLIDSFDVEAKVTGADISPDKSHICLTAYNKNNNVYLWIFNNFNGADFFSGNSKKYTLGDFTEVGQVEAVTFINNSKLFLSSEKLNSLPPKLYRFNR